MSARATSAAEILAERARKLAIPTDVAASSVPGSEMLAFTVGRERYAVESRYVFSTVKLDDLVPLPGAQTPVAGVTRWRGDVLTVLDFRRAVGGAPRALDDLGRVIVLGDSIPRFGVLADTVDGLLAVDLSGLYPLPSTRAVEIAGLVRGVTTDAVHVIDVQVLIAHQTAASYASAIVGPPSTSGST